MKEVKRVVSEYLLVIFLFIGIPIIIAVASLWVASFETGDIYETNNVADYGVIKGNYNNEKPKEFIGSFFPLKIEDSFSDVTYHYKAKKIDTYGYEIYLEFEILDKQEFKEFVSANVKVEETKPFKHDDSFYEYEISNVFEISGPTESMGYSIVYAKIGKILISESEQRIIFVAIGVYDGGGTGTNDIDYFFNRFGIEPLNFATKVYD